MPKQANFYVVSQDLSVVKCNSFEDCITYEDFFYAIQEANDVGTLNVRLLDASGDEFTIEENGWKVVGVKAENLRYLSLSSDWNTANKRKYHIELKKLFTRIKNGHSSHYLVYINDDEDHSIEISFENGQFVMNSYIEVGDFLMERKSEEIYTNADFYQFIKFVLKKFPAIDLAD